MLASDPVGATWGTGVRRAPNVTSWGWNRAAAAKVTVPTLLIAPVHDVQVSPKTVMQLHADLGSTEKVLVDLACSSHNALWERIHGQMFEASREWLQVGSVRGAKTGTVRIGY
jgi:pimeloyl-ACP methyl ester carboxylesterase